MVDGREDELDGVRVAAVDGRLRDPGGGGDARERHVLKAVADEDLARRGEDRAIDLRVQGAPGAARRWGRAGVHLHIVSSSATLSFETSRSETKETHVSHRSLIESFYAANGPMADDATLERTFHPDYVSHASPPETPPAWLRPLICATS